jgi:adenylylsulfate kinase
METKARSFLKSVSYRVFASIVTAIIVYCFTGKLLLAVGLGVLDSTVKILVYFLHERLWAMIPYGRVKHPLEEFPVNKPLSEEDKKILEEKLKNMGYLGENI